MKSWNVAYAQYGPRDPFEKCAQMTWEQIEATRALVAMRDMARRTPGEWAAGLADDIDAFLSGKEKKASQEEVEK